MQGVTIKIFYGIRYYDQEYDMSKWHYDYETIESQGNDRGNTGGIYNTLTNITQRLRILLSEE